MRYFLCILKVFFIVFVFVGLSIFRYRFLVCFFFFMTSCKIIILISNLHSSYTSFMKFRFPLEYLKGNSNIFEKKEHLITINIADKCCWRRSQFVTHWPIVRNQRRTGRNNTLLWRTETLSSWASAIGPLSALRYPCRRPGYRLVNLTPVGIWSFHYYFLSASKGKRHFLDVTWRLWKQLVEVVWSYWCQISN